MPRKATRYGGPGHPFEGGEIRITLTWDVGIEVRLVVPEGATHAPVLPKYVLQQIDEKCMPIRELVYGAQWDAATLPQRLAEAEAERLQREEEDRLEAEAQAETHPPFEIEIVKHEQG